MMFPCTVTEKKKGFVRIESNLSDLLKYADNSYTWADNGYSDANKELFNSFIQPRFDHFAGGTVQELRDGLHGLLPVQELTEDKVSAALLERIQTRYAPKQARQRALDEYDGEYDFDRRWEHEPFFSVKSQDKRARELTIYAHIAASCMINSREITQKGRLLAAIANVIEASGVRTRLYVSNKGSSVDASHSMGNQNDILIKDTDQYVEQSVIATCFSGNFFRRIGFAGIVHCCHVNNKDSYSGLGCPDAPRTTTATPGVLTLSMGSLTPDESSADDLYKKLVEALENSDAPPMTENVTPDEPESTEEKKSDDTSDFPPGSLVRIDGCRKGRTKDRSKYNGKIGEVQRKVISYFRGKFSTKYRVKFQDGTNADFIPSTMRKV